MDFGNPFVTSNERSDIINKLYSYQHTSNSILLILFKHRKRYLAAMLEDQSPLSLLNSAPRINEMAVRFEENVWRTTNSREEYSRAIQAKIQVVQQQRSTISTNSTTNAIASGNTRSGGSVQASISSSSLH